MCRTAMTKAASSGAFSTSSNMKRPCRPHEDEHWNRRFAELVHYKEKHGDCLVSKFTKEYAALGRWVITQRMFYKKKRMQKDRVDRLNSIGFAWTDGFFESMFKRLVSYKETHGNCLVPYQYNDDPALGCWVNNQRRAYKLKKLYQHRIDKLNSVGFAWSVGSRPKSLGFGEMVARLEKYKAENGNCLVPHTFKDDPKLGRWVQNQRHRRKKLPQERIERLNSIGFIWIVQDKSKEYFETMFRRLVSYKKVYGNCMVPYNYEKDQNLAHWVTSQRLAYKRKKLPQDRVEQLNSIGFIWIHNCIDC